MNWSDRARREISGNLDRPTANTAERSLTAVLAVPRSRRVAETQDSIGSNGSASAEVSAETVELSEDFEERAAIMEFDGGLSREDAERAARALLRARRQAY